jgi:hypothetical protein
MTALLDLGSGWQGAIRLAGRQIDHALSPFVQVAGAFGMLWGHAASMAPVASGFQLLLALPYSNWTTTQSPKGTPHYN